MSCTAWLPRTCAYFLSSPSNAFPPLSLFNANAFFKGHLLCEAFFNYSPCLVNTPGQTTTPSYVSCCGVQMSNLWHPSLNDDVLVGRDLGGISYTCMTYQKKWVECLKNHRALDSDLTPGDAASEDMVLALWGQKESAGGSPGFLFSQRERCLTLGNFAAPMIQKHLSVQKKLRQLLSSIYTSPAQFHSSKISAKLKTQDLSQDKD